MRIGLPNREQNRDGGYLDGRVLVATPTIRDERFARAVIYMCAHSSEGAMGIVINQPAPHVNFSELLVQLQVIPAANPIEFAPKADAVRVLKGGPVQTERGFVLHEPLPEGSAEGGPYNSSLKVEGGLEMTTSKDVLEAISSGAGPKKVLVTLGYSGWGAGQLEEEMSRNGWINVEAQPGIIFDTPVSQRYGKALSLLGIDAGMLSSDAGHA